MSYHIYTTKGIVLSEESRREADRVYSIMTRDLGLLRATGLGVRKGESKLRGALEPYILSRVSLVRGKEFWRITSAESIQTIAPLPIIARPLALLETLVQGEDANPELFDVVEHALGPTCSTPSVEQVGPDEMFEVKLVSQILYHLGYLKREDLKLSKKALIEAINEGIQHSHLT